ncbi:MAG: nucleotidyltransferase family protein [Micavibrio aeruginosavorus]|uniref:Nucleotidyltransferase family protein n=1 Tax=Micavibrio aeruginosavorus TaxID=349221 RepID=A0A2W5PV49_9BACT|nr:MAG: nucleotidyltransferase family protein [Micavibrio aeruginosavorus]
MSSKPQKAFILAAGKGTRLRPYTDAMPKPMVAIAGRSIIRRTIEKLSDVGVKEIVINLHHLGDVLKQHLQDISQPRLILSEEQDLLETGGGIKHALHHFGNDPFYIINGDALWEEGTGAPILERLANAWDGTAMDILQMVQPKDKMALTGFVGDYDMDNKGRLTRSKEKQGAYMFGGIRIAHPRIFKDSPDGAFSFLQLMDKAQEEKKLFGIAHNGEWYHISTPEDLHAVDADFRRREAA